jgi:hypothetical protein
LLLFILYLYLSKSGDASEIALIILSCLLALGLFNSVRISPHVVINGRLATLLNFILPGLGQVYMKQVKLGSLLAVLFMVGFAFHQKFIYIFGTENPIHLYLTLGLALALQYILLPSAKEKAAAKRNHQLGMMKYTRLKPVIERGTILCLDTNILLHEQMFLIALHRDSDAHIFVSKQVYRELDGLKKNKKPDVRNRAQLAFDLIELFQGDKRLTMLDVPPHTYLRKKNLASSPDEMIIGTYLFEQNRVSNPLVFLSNDKGARILAVNAQFNTVTI